MSLASLKAHGLLLLGFLSTKAVADAHRETTWIWDPDCKTGAKETIQQGFKDALMMAKKVDSKIDFRSDNAAIDYFGVDTIEALGDPGIAGIFETFTKSEWRFTVSCPANNSTKAACVAEQGNFGGIVGSSLVYSNATSNSTSRLTRRSDPDSSENTRDVQLSFCDEFFQNPPLAHKTADNLWGGDLSNRTNINMYLWNQGTSMLRELLHHLPPQAPLDKPIFDAFIRVNEASPGQLPGLSLISGYGAVGSKLLARIKGKELYSARNANNYALFALAKYLETKVINTYPWLPRTDYLNSVPMLAKLTDDTINAVNTSIVTALDSPNVVSIIKPDQKVNNFIKDRILDATGVAFRAGDDYPKESLDAWNKFFDDTKAVKGNEINTYLRKEIKCVARNETRYLGPSLQPFTRDQAAASIRDFCGREDLLSFHIVPKVRLSNMTTPGGNHKVLDVWTEATAPGNDKVELSIGLTLKPGMAVLTNETKYFEGKTEFENRDSCRRTLESVIDACDQTTPEVKFGGLLEFTDGRIFTVLGRKPNAPNSPAQISATQYDNPGALNCKPVDRSLLWLPKAYNVTENTCACSFEKFAKDQNLFCKQADGGCGTLSADGIANMQDAVELSEVGKPCV